MKYRTDLSIAQSVKPQDIDIIAKKLGVSQDRLYRIGSHMAKILPESQGEKQNSTRSQGKGKLVLVTAMNPTKAGEGKTTVTVGLGDALALLGKNVAITLREPSMGPVFGIKGGAAGGGWSQVVPMEDLNLHFTGDIHAVTSAHNLLSALADNHLYRRLDPRLISDKMTWHRVLDMNDRALRSVVLGAGNDSGSARLSGFSITAASEVMAILCLAKDGEDLKERLGNIILGTGEKGQLIRARDIGAQGALAVVLHKAQYPNLVQTLAGTPVLVHGGPFANIAHGTNSIMADKIAMDLADVVVTEAGFGADLGAQKFMDLVGPMGNIRPDAAVVVTTIRALKHHGGGEQEAGSLKKGMENIIAHLTNMRDIYQVEPVAAVNQFPTDTQEELDLVLNIIREHGFKAQIAQVWADGGKGGQDLAKEVMSILDSKSQPASSTDPKTWHHAAAPGLTIKESIEAIATKIYGADSVNFSSTALSKLKKFADQGIDRLPVCIAKTQYSFSADPALLGRPRGFEFPVRDLSVSGGAGFVVAYGGDIMTMPGLSKVPAANGMDMDEGGIITGLF